MNLKKLIHLHQVKFLLVILLLGVTMFANAQQVSFTHNGSVKDSTGEPLIGVTVLNKTSGEGCITDVNGHYSIKAAAGDELIFSYIGMTSSTQKVKSPQQSIHVVLSVDNITLQDVVVIGYGSKEKKSITSSIGSVKKDDIQRLASTSTTMDNMLAGTVKGVLSVQSSGEPGSAPRINVRGITSPYPNLSGQSGNVPLYVIDGVPMFMDNNKINPLMNIAPSDIESIDILKDASATAIYGSRGANGVIIVKTKAGKRGEDLKVDFNYNFSFSNPVKKHDALNVAEFKKQQHTLLSNTVTAMNKQLSSGSMYYMQTMFDPSFPNVFKMGKINMDMNTGQFTYDGLNEDAFGSANTNWEDEVLNANAPTHNYNIGLSGGTDKLTYNVSFNGLNQEGLYINDKMDHYGVRVALDARISNSVRAGVVLNNAYSSRTSGAGAGSATVDYWLVRPDMPVYAADGSYQRIDMSPLYLSNASGANPVAQRQGDNRFKAKQMTGNAYVIVDILKGLTARADFSLANYDYENSYFTPQKAIDTTPFSSAASTLSESYSTNYNTSLNFRLDYTLLKDRHNFTAMLGYGSDRSSYKSKSTSYEGFPNDEHLNNPGSAQYVKSYSDLISRGGLNSIYSRLTYGYDNTYLTELSLRTDESSKFGPDHRWGFFPALSLGWVMSNEEWLKNVSAVNNLKLRLSVGQTGSTNVADFSYRQYLVKGAEGQYGQNLAVSLKDLLPNEGIKWEMTTEYNAGLDFSFFENRVFGSVDAYYRFTKGALAPAPHTLESGFTTYYSNLLDMSNRGLEFELGADIIKSNDFLWNSSINVALNRNKIEKLNGASIVSGMQDAYIEGKPAGTLKGYVVEKIFQTQEEIDALNNIAAEKGQYYYQPDCAPGDYMFKDLNGDGTIDSQDRAVIATPEPKFFGGWTNNLTYKNFQLSFLFQYSVGGEAMYSPLMTDAMGQIGVGVTREMYENSWTPENTGAKYAQLVAYAYNNYNWTKNDRFVFNTSYIRLKNITLTYELPKKLTQNFKMTNASVYVTGSNLFTITKWPGQDPEMLGSAVTLMSTGYDAYPISRSFTLGVRLGF